MQQTNSTVTLQAVGLNLSPNQLSLPDGSLTVANNVIIKRDNVIESRRGFGLYGTEFGTFTDYAKQLLIYKERILRHFDTTLSFDSDNAGTFLDFSGSYSEPEAGIRLKGIESNGNFYFTTSNGIKKISAATANDFSTASNFITDAGGVKAVDINASLNYQYGDQSDFLLQDSAVAYRVVWGYTDANNNLILGTPSQRSTVFNPLLGLMLQDLMHLLVTLDDINQVGSLITNGDYASSLAVKVGTSATQLYLNLQSLTKKIDNDILYADDVAVAPLQIASATISSGVCTVTFASGDASTFWSGGNHIKLAGFTPATDTLNGAQIITTVSPTTITFNTTATGTVVLASPTINSNEYESITVPSVPSEPSTDQQLVDLQKYIQTIISKLAAEPITVISTFLHDTFISNLDVTTASTVTLDISIPDRVIFNKHFYQVYRSNVFQATGTTVLLTDVAPNDELQLVYEAFPTQAEISAGFLTIVDVTPDAFKGANLYTNPSSGEGILQSNEVPPLAHDINLFKNVAFYANTQSKQNKTLSLIGVSNMIADYNNNITPTLTVANGDIFNTYSFILGISQVETVTCGAAGTLNSSGNGNHFLLNSARNLNKYYVWYQLGTSVDPQIANRTGIEVVIQAGFTATQVAAKTRDTLNQFINDFNCTSSTPTVTINLVNPGYTDTVSDGDTGFTFARIVEGTGEKVSQQSGQFVTVADVANSLASKFILLNGAFNVNRNYLWFTVSGNGVDPAIPGKVGINVDLVTNDSAAIVAQKISQTLNNDYSNLYTANSFTNNVVITNVKYGSSDPFTVGNSGFTLTNVNSGSLQVELSDVVSPAQAVENTALSLVRVMNRNKTETIFNYYISSAGDVPGKMNLEGRSLSTPQFFITSNNVDTGLSFNPGIDPDFTITSITTGSPSTMLITTSTPHGLVNLDYVEISGSDSLPSIDGIYQITYVSDTTFRIDVTIATAGTIGGVIALTNAVASSNDIIHNRVFFSKLQQPEAVPLVNFLNVGAKDKKILRIFPLRDSLFVFKEDGLYRISGEVSPFNLALFDISCFLVAPDSVAASNNIIYCWTRQGISMITESGVNTVSRPIDTSILKLASSNYPNFATATWGTGYESDNSYLVWTVSKEQDTIATQCFRFSNLTRTWTIFTLSCTSGVVHPVKDKLYLGSGTINKLEEERKGFSRYDYADRQIDQDLGINSVFGDSLHLTDVTELDVNDVIVQDQTISTYEYNMLLKKLDLDPGTATKTYYTSLVASAGVDLRSKLLALTAMLDVDTGIAQTIFTSTIDTKAGSITNISATNPTVLTCVGHGLLTGRVISIVGTDSSPVINGISSVTVIDANTFSIDKSVISPGTTGSFVTVNQNFDDLKTCYNEVIRLLNTDSGTAFKNYYKIVNETSIETNIAAINSANKMVQLGSSLNFVVGPIKIFKSIKCEVQYAPNVIGDPLRSKQLSEATVMFINRAFTNATISFATDLMPSFESVIFTGDGSGIFGANSFGNHLFGGLSNSAPFRTYIPRNKQRCRYMIVNYKHSVAREQWSIFGITLTGSLYISQRAYR